MEKTATAFDANGEILWIAEMFPEGSTIAAIKAPMEKVFSADKIICSDGRILHNRRGSID